MAAGPVRQLCDLIPHIIMRSFFVQSPLFLIKISKNDIIISILEKIIEFSPYELFLFVIAAKTGEQMNDANKKRDIYKRQEWNGNRIL